MKSSANAEIEKLSTSFSVAQAGIQTQETLTCPYRISEQTM